ncbi:MAG: phage protein NinX family protein [Desulfuromonadaceae bacterium]
MKTAEITVQYLDHLGTDLTVVNAAQSRAVAKCLGDDISYGLTDDERYSTDWAQGGPIIGRIKGLQIKNWLESRPETCCEAHIHTYEGDWIQFGSTPLIAALRCYVSVKLGDEVEVPDDLTSS